MGFLERGLKNVGAYHTQHSHTSTPVSRKTQTKTQWHKRVDTNDLCYDKSFMTREHLQAEAAGSGVAET